MKIIITAFVFLLSICICLGQNRKVLITGKAESLKEAATVVTKDEKRYYINGLGRWDKNYEGKKVRVTGVLIFRKYKTDINEPPSQNISGINRIIIKAKFNLLK